MYPLTGFNIMNSFFQFSLENSDYYLKESDPMKKFIDDFVMVCKLSTNNNSNRQKHFEKTLLKFFGKQKFKQEVLKFIEISKVCFAKADVKILRSK